MSTSAASSLSQLIQEAAEQTKSPISTEALATKEVASYIRSLSNLSLSDLRNQPHQLQAKSDALHVQLSELCISQTDAFIHIHQAEQRFGPALESLASNLSDLIQKSIPDLHAAADAFLAQSRPALDQKKRIQNVADQYERGHLSDLLDIPPLVHTCVKAGHHSEAIQLTEHLIGLLGAPETPVSDSQAIQHGQRSTYLSLLIETLSNLAAMKADLLAGFSKPSIKLPAVRKSVTVLRRLNHIQSSLARIPDWTSIVASQLFSSLIPQLGITENQLCLVFLKARIHSFRASLNAMGSPSTVNSHAYLRRYIDLWRQEMADTLGMAFPLFVDDATSVQHGNEHADQDDMISPAYLLASFATSGLDLLRRTVSAQLKAAAQRLSASASVQGDSSASLQAFAEMCSNVHTQLSYASAALARFGLDFGELLFSPVDLPDQDLTSMEAIWLDVLSRSLDDAFSYIHEQLDQHTSGTDALPSHWLLSSQLSSTALQELFTISASDAAPSAYDDFARPNIELVDYPPFGRLLNRIMEWINALQIFAPVSLATPLLQRLDAHFSRVTERILAEIPQAITTSRGDATHTRLLDDDDAKSFLEHLDPEAEAEMSSALVRDRESAILAKTLRMWNASVVQWVLHVVQSCFSDDDSQNQARNEHVEMKTAWTKAHDWIRSTEARIVQHNIKRKNDAEARKDAVEEAAAKAKAEEEARAKAQEEARLKAEAEAKAKAEAEAKARAAEEEARAKAEHEAKAKAEAEAAAKAKAEAEARAKAEAEARKAEAEAKAKAEEQARLKAEEEARAKAEAEAKAKAEAQARAKAEAEAEAKAKANAEAEAAAAAAKAAEAEAKAKAKAEAEAAAAAAKAAEAEAKAKAEAEAEAAAKAKAEAEAEAEAERARIEREEEAAAKVKAEAEAQVKAEEEAAARAKAEEKAAAKAQAEVEAESARVASEKAAAEAEAAARAKAESEAAAERARVAAQQKVGETESQTQDGTDTGAEQEQTSGGSDTAAPAKPAEAAPTKKFSLAEKLRQRKEERDRAATAAAAAAAAAATSMSQVEASQEQAKPADKPEPPSDDVAPEEPSQTTQNEETKPDEAAAAVADGGSSDVHDEAQDEDDEADSGANTPTTPVTPSTPNPANSPAKKNKKKKNKKKK